MPPHGPAAGPELPPRLPARGPFPSSVAQRAGLGRTAVRGAVARGELWRPRVGVLARPGDLDDLLARARAAQIALGSAAVLSHETAAAVLGSTVAQEGPVHVTVPPGSGVGRAAGVQRHRVALAPGDVQRHRGLVVTTPARTLLDLARRSGHEDAVVAVDALAHRWPGSLAAAAARLDALRGARGVASARRVLAEAEPLAESPQESRLRLRLVAAGFPRPEAQYRLREPSGRVVARLDLAWPDLRLGVEYDGRDAHPLGLSRDRERAWQAHRAGFLLVHVTAELLADERRLTARVREARELQAGRTGTAA